MVAPPGGWAGEWLVARQNGAGDRSKRYQALAWQLLVRLCWHIVPRHQTGTKKLRRGRCNFGLIFPGRSLSILLREEEVAAIRAWQNPGNLPAAKIVSGGQSGVNRATPESRRWRDGGYSNIRPRNCATYSFSLPKYDMDGRNRHSMTPGSFPRRQLCCHVLQRDQFPKRFLATQRKAQQRVHRGRV